MGKRSAKDRQAGSSLAANQCATNKELAAVGVHAHDEPRRHPPTWFVCCMSILDCQCYLIPCEVLALIPLCVVAPYFIYHVVSTYITTNPFYCFASTAVVAAMYGTSAMLCGTLMWNASHAPSHTLSHSSSGRGTRRSDMKR